ncbi:hypothetical protein PCANC_22406 [Puccinia coronata f. sp. avenae]|uniref:Uncharacterized protein n=1 Tax=Puccinia coronata f. sp. avenae TaxID=200324 RepID=A0A2N5TUI2_9BASI|nr:hypothetical protein PCANC_22406 [Puccinia coronata f. sp. avenae]
MDDPNFQLVDRSRQTYRCLICPHARELTDVAKHRQRPNHVLNARLAAAPSAVDQHRRSSPTGTLPPDEEDEATREAQEAERADQVWASMEGLYDREDPPTPPRVQRTLEEELDEIDPIISGVEDSLPLIAHGRWEEVLEAELEALQEGPMPPASADQDHKSSRTKSDGARGQPSATWYPFKSKMVPAVISKMSASGTCVLTDVLPQTLIAQDLANPLITPDLDFYPEASKGTNVYKFSQSFKWLKGLAPAHRPQMCKVKMKHF